MTNPKTNKTPYFAELSDAALVENYWGYRALAANAAALKSTRLGHLLRCLDICAGLARKRGLSLAR